MPRRTVCVCAHARRRGRGSVWLGPVRRERPAFASALYFRGSSLCRTPTDPGGMWGVCVHHMRSGTEGWALSISTAGSQTETVSGGGEEPSRCVQKSRKRASGRILSVTTRNSKLPRREWNYSVNRDQVPGQPRNPPTLLAGTGTAGRVDILCLPPTHSIHWTESVNTSCRKGGWGGVPRSLRNCSCG